MDQAHGNVPRIGHCFDQDYGRPCPGTIWNCPRDTTVQFFTIHYSALQGETICFGSALDIARIRQREALPRLLRQFAAQTGQLLNITKAGQAAGLESSTENRYATLLEAAFMIQRLPAWGVTLD